MSSNQADRIVAALTAEQSELRTDGVRLVLDFVLARPLTQLIDIDETRRIVVGALTEDNVARIIERHVKPGFARYSERIRETKDPVGSLVPDGARQRIRDTVASSRPPKGKWAQGAVDPALIRKLFAPVFTQVLLSFAKRMPGPGGAAAASASAVGREVGGLAEKLGKRVQKGAAGLVGAGRQVMGGLGAEMERRIAAAAREFSDTAMSVWREALRERLRSDEGRQLVRQISQQVTDHIMMTELSALHDDVDRMPVEEILDIAPAVIAHATPHRLVQAIINAEVEAFFAIEGKRSLRELLDELAITEQVVQATAKQVDALARDLLATENFRDWLTRALKV